MLKKKQPEEKQKTKKIKTIQSTQQNIPIQEITNGIIVTKDGRYVKIIEVLPTPFFLKTIAEQNKIYDDFVRLLRSAPANIQFKSVALPTNISKQLDILDEDRKKETNENCKAIDDEYEKRLIQSQYYGVYRRFFVVVSYSNKEGGIFNRKNMSFNEITRYLENITSRINQILRNSGNEIVDKDSVNLNGHVAEILYVLLNRKKSQLVSYEKNLESVFDKYFKAYNDSRFYVPPTEYISPNKITYTSDRILVDDMYYGYLFITSDGYPTIAPIGWMNLFINQGIGVDVDIFLTKYSKESVDNKIRRSRARSGANTTDINVNSKAFESTNVTLSSTDYLLKGIAAGEEFYYVTTIITVCDENPEVLIEKMAEIEKTAKENDIKLMELKGQAEQAFLSTLPLCNLDKGIHYKTRRNILTHGAATLYPLTSFQVTDPQGIYFGDDMQTGSLAIIDIFKRQKPGRKTGFVNSNGFIAGTTGAGKTFTLLLIAMRARIKHIPIMIISPAKAVEYVRASRELGGECVDIGEGSRNVINLMQIYQRDESVDESELLIDGVTKTKSLLMEKAANIKRFFQLLIEDITIEEKQILDEAIIKTYAKFGITEDNESLWNEDRTAYKKMPILSDLKETIYELDRSQRLKTVSSFITSGSASFFDGQTNVDLNNNFIVYMLDNCSPELLPLAVFVVMDYCWSKIKEDRTKKKMLFIDEWWKMAFNETAAAYSLEISKTIRAYGGAFWVATQQMTDVKGIEDGKYGKPVINNSSIKILMHMEDDDLEATRSMIRISDKEAESISKFSSGQALFLAGNNRMTIRFVASGTEYDLITTNADDLNRIKLENAEKMRLKKMREEIDNAPDIDNLFISSDDIDDLFETSSELMARKEEEENPFISTQELKELMKGVNE